MYKPQLQGCNTALQLPSPVAGFGSSSAAPCKCSGSVWTPAHHIAAPGAISALVLRTLGLLHGQFLLAQIPKLPEDCQQHDGSRRGNGAATEAADVAETHLHRHI